MSCYRPIRAWRTGTGVSFVERGDVRQQIFIPCGMCIGCRAQRASDWATRCMHEASLSERNCFVTLTYGPGNLPPGSSLCHRDFQLFMKRLRRYFGHQVRFFMCGEYGPLNLRPHYHVCLFGVDFRSDQTPCGKSDSGAVFFDSPILTNLWSHGRVSVQELTRETAGYCARYVMKKLLGASAKDSEAKRAREWTDAGGEVHERTMEYCCMSKKPGIGYYWFFRFLPDVVNGDAVVLYGGRKERPPKYYDKLLKRKDLDRSEGVKFQREVDARARFADSTEERLAVREVVHAARIRNQKRSLDL